MLHVTFSESAAVSLKEVLRELGRAERVLPLVDDLSMGPINPVSTRARAAWIDAELGYEEDREETDSIDAFWAAVTAPDASAIAWFSRRSAREYTGFLELLWRRGDAATAVVDVTDIEFSGRDGRPAPDTSACFAFVRASQIVAQRLLGRARTLSRNELDRDRETWRRLRMENAALRVLDSTAGLISAPITFFDDLILSCTTEDWQPSGRVIGGSIGKSSSPYDQIGDLFLWSRLLELVEVGALEGRGDFSTMQTSWVRRPTRAPLA
jgi:hypothetical protein